MRLNIEIEAKDFRSMIRLAGKVLDKVFGLPDPAHSGHVTTKKERGVDYRYELRFTN